MPVGTVPRYKIVHCKVCGEVIHRFDRTKFPGHHVPVEAIMTETRRHYKFKHPQKFQESIKKGVRTRMGLPVKNLPCPICKTLNPVSQANARLKCSKCGTNLVSVRVKKNIKRG